MNPIIGGSYMIKKARKRLGDILVESKQITAEQLEKALIVQKESGERLGKVLIQLGFITEKSIIEVLEFQLGVPHIDLFDILIDKTVATLIPVSLAEKYKIIPIAKHNSILKLAMVDPTNFFAMDDVRMVTGCEIQPFIATEKDVMRAIRQCYGVSELVEKAVNQLRPGDAIAAPEIDAADDAPIISIVNSLITQAIKDRVSDIHIEPLENEVRVRFRVDGMLREVISFPKYSHAAIISRIKVISGMNIAEKRLPQDGRIMIQESGNEVDIRTSTLPTIRGEKVVMRILDKKAIILDVHSLGLAQENIEKYYQLYTRSYGMILVTGPTGSGKTTTLYSTLTALNSSEKNIITVEDPVEYLLEGINQIQVNHKTGMTFASGLRSILRQDPNIIMVGEIRDSETADIAIRAALTGHLVLSTLHTNDACGAITRLVDMGIEPFLISSSVLGVVAQRLVRVICPDCKKAYIPAPDSHERSFLKLQPEDSIVLYKGTGCSRCNHSGYQGRIAIHEVLPLTNRLKELINQGISGHELAIAAERAGMRSMVQDGVDKALKGCTTLGEVMRVAYAQI